MQKVVFILTSFFFNHVPINESKVRIFSQRRIILKQPVSDLGFHREVLLRLTASDKIHQYPKDPDAETNKTSSQDHYHYQQSTVHQFETKENAVDL